MSEAPRREYQPRQTRYSDIQGLCKAWGLKACVSWDDLAQQAPFAMTARRWAVKLEAVSDQNTHC